MQSKGQGIFDIHGIVADNAQLTILGEGFTFTEGPAADKEGNVFFTDQPNNKIIKWDAHTKQLSTFMENSGRANGMYFNASDNLIACADMKGEVWSIDNKGNHQVLVDNFNGKILNGPNDVWIAPNGSLYLTDPLYPRDYWDADDPRKSGTQQGGQYLYYLSEDRKTFKRVDEPLVKPNGIIGTPDGKKLYVADIEASKTYVYDIQSDGSLSNRQLFSSMMSDGMTIDNQGNVYLTNNQGVTAFDKTGFKIFNVPTGEGWTANVTFGGAERNLLFITAKGKVYGLQMKVKGVK
jgi:gluconolactonase